MKKYLFLALALFALVACSKDDEKDGSSGPSLANTNITLTEFSYDGLSWIPLKYYSYIKFGNSNHYTLFYEDKETGTYKYDSGCFFFTADNGASIMDKGWLKGNVLMLQGSSSLGVFYLRGTK